MKGSYFLGNRSFEVRETETPVPAGRQVLVQVKACGVCGTDVHIYHGEKGSADVTPPVILGHEFSGIVTAVGEQVETLRVGDHVTVDPNMYCGICRPCKIGKKQLCRHLVATGVTENGGFADYCIVREQQCFKLGDQVNFRHGAMAEPLACCIHGIDIAKIRHGDNVCIIGGGAIGLIMVQLAKLAGAAQVVLSEPVESRRKIAYAVGADHAVDPMSQDLSQTLCRLLDSDGADVVIECVGNPIAAKQALAAAGTGATIVFFSVPKDGETLELPLFDVYKKELTIRGSIINPCTQQRAVDLINSGKLHLDELITHHFPLEQLQDAILMQMSNESVKVMVEAE